MRCPFVLGVAAMAIAIVGCGDGKPGGPGANKPDGSTASRGSAETFTLDVQNTAIDLKQGETKTTTIGIKRGKNIDEDVKLSFRDIPKGVTFDPSAPMIKHGDEKVSVNVSAAADAAIGDFTVYVIGKPGKGADAEAKLTVKVSAK